MSASSSAAPTSLAGVSAALRQSLNQPLVQLRPPGVPTHVQAWPPVQQPHAWSSSVEQQQQHQQQHVTVTVHPDNTVVNAPAGGPAGALPAARPAPIPAPQASAAALIQMAALSALPASSSAPPQPPEPHLQPRQQPPQPAAAPPGAASAPWLPPPPPAQKQPWVPSLPAASHSAHPPPPSSSASPVPLGPRTATTQPHTLPLPPSAQWAAEALQRQQQQQQQQQALPPGRITSPGAPSSVHAHDVRLVDGGQASPGTGPQQQHRQRSLAARASASGGGGTAAAAAGLQHASSWPEQPPWQHLPPVRGTLRGVYKGRAPEEWLAKEVQKEVDDLAKCVDAFSVVREERLAATRRAALQGQCEALSAERSALAQRVAQLSLLLPEEDGEFRRLRAELARLERDCDAHFARYQVEMRAKAASDELARELRARLTWLESQLTTFGIAIMSPAAPGGPPLLTAARARAALKPDGTVVLEADPDRAPSGGGGGGDDDTRDQRQGDGTVGPPGEAAGQQATAAATGGAPPHVTPEAILAAVEYLREKGELPPSSGIGRFPSRQAVALRILLLVVLIGTVTGAVLATYFLTKAYGR